MKGIRRFRIKGKLSPRYVGPYEILDRVGDWAYRLALPNSMERIHNVFHVSQLRRYVADPSHILSPDELELNEDLSYEELPLWIMDTKVRTTRNRDIRMVKPNKKSLSKQDKGKRKTGEEKDLKAKIGKVARRMTKGIASQEL
ncbi:uncharacterized protein LOC127260257 [Andrographis paniculata]|uniref:uncharacterized protein LOC127260257 n=1 Tax=Andrographis paniculata TaxID=175694 RepID=UPI0021E98536|nr:uncharacterized protein LOC127260257 [Andrographis paniculata]